MESSLVRTNARQELAALQSALRFRSGIPVSLTKAADFAIRFTLDRIQNEIEDERDAKRGPRISTTRGVPLALARAIVAELERESQS